jgi:hypothetical protein
LAASAALSTIRAIMSGDSGLPRSETNTNVCRCCENRRRGGVRGRRASMEPRKGRCRPQLACYVTRHAAPKLNYCTITRDRAHARGDLGDRTHLGLASRLGWMRIDKPFAPDRRHNGGPPLDDDQAGNKPRRGGGRPTIATPELIEALLDRVAEGVSLRAICRDPSMPSRRGDALRTLGIAHRVARSRGLQMPPGG